MTEHTFRIVTNRHVPSGISSAAVVVDRPSQRRPRSPPEQTRTPPGEPLDHEHNAVPVPDAAVAGPSRMQSVFSSHTGEAYRSQQHSNQTWESHKEAIRQLYLDENRPLKEVIAIMRQRGFKATVRMYKSRFDKWGFSKNNSKRDVIQMLQIQRQRNALGKRTTFHRNGREVAIDAYLKRKGISQYDLAEPGIAEQLPDHLRCVTPPPDVPALIHPGGAVSLQEVLLQTVRDLAWNAVCPPDLPLVSATAKYRGGALRCAITDLTNADWLFHVGHNKRAGTMCEQGFRALHLMIQQPSVYGLVHLLLVHLDAYNRGVVYEIWKYLACYSEAIKTEGPLARLCQGIFKFLHSHDYAESWTFILECVEKLLLLAPEDEAAAGLPTDTVARLYPLFFIPRAHQYPQEVPRRLQARCDWSRLAQRQIPTEENTTLRRRDPQEETIFQASELLITGAQASWRGAHTLHLAEKVLEGVKAFDYNTEFFEYVALTTLAKYHRAAYDDNRNRHGPSRKKNKDKANEVHRLSTHFLDRACRLMEGKWDPDLGYFLGDLELLEEWHREAGDTEQAAATRVRWEEALDCIPTQWERGTQGIRF
ncbi:hypothetical protein F4780DRAFT_783604 [Xylariomycetidae sp. FL0641]|nr:hypothetical protein F4780DRAFT_783604 [Xylariomycetidae sp. FL0641]